FLAESCDSISSAHEDTLYPHIIVQYDQGMRVQAGDIDVQTPFPNRLIYVNDPANASLVLSDQLGTLLSVVARQRARGRLRQRLVCAPEGCLQPYARQRSGQRSARRGGRPTFPERKPPWPDRPRSRPPARPSTHHSP